MTNVQRKSNYNFFFAKFNLITLLQGECQHKFHEEPSNESSREVKQFERNRKAKHFEKLPHSGNFVCFGTIISHKQAFLKNI